MNHFFDKGVAFVDIPQHMLGTKFSIFDMPAQFQNIVDPHGSFKKRLQHILFAGLNFFGDHNLSLTAQQGNQSHLTEVHFYGICHRAEIG